jgi:hypothetical protein
VFHRQSAVAVKLKLVLPGFAFRQLLYGEALHRLDKSSFHTRGRHLFLLLEWQSEGFFIADCESAAFCLELMAPVYTYDEAVGR